MKTIKIKIKDLFDTFNIGNTLEKVYELPEGIFIKTPNNENVPVFSGITKNKESEEIYLESGKYLKAAKKHLVLENGILKFMKDCDFIDTLDGTEKIIKRNNVGKIKLYDISIPSPHLYVTENKIIHHNTFFVLGGIKSFLDSNPTGIVFYYDTESTISKEFLDKRGIDSTRVLIIEPTDVEDFKIKIIQFCKLYEETPEKERVPVAMVLDSLGMLPDNKEIDDAIGGDVKTDMGGRAKKIKSLFRSITVKLGMLDIPLFVTAHTYSSQGMFPTDIVSGGTGLTYSSTNILGLGKALEKDGKDVTGVIIRCKTMKSRTSKENNVVRVLIDYSSGLDRYYGLLELAEAAKVFKKITTRYEVNGKMVFGKTINEHPEEYYTQEVLEKINEYVKQAFNYQGKLSFDAGDILDNAKESESEEIFID